MFVPTPIILITLDWNPPNLLPINLMSLTYVPMWVGMRNPLIDPVSLFIPSKYTELKITVPTPDPESKGSIFTCATEGDAT